MQFNLQLTDQRILCMMHPHFWVHSRLIRMHLLFYTQVCFSFYPSISSFWDTSFLDQRLLMSDLLSVHLVRNIHGSTIISFHPTLNISATTAKFLHERVRFAGACKLITILIRLFNSNSRPKRVLAKYVPKVARPHSRPSNIYMARHVCMGWGPWTFIRTYLFTSELCSFVYSMQFWLEDRKTACSQLRKCHWPESSILSELIIFTIFLSSITIQNISCSSKIHPTLLWIA
jgi:hypothetical protein